MTPEQHVAALTMPFLAPIDPNHYMNFMTDAMLRRIVEENYERDVYSVDEKFDAGVILHNRSFEKNSR